MMKNIAKPILVTGCPRSGTTWIGKMIAKCDSTAYLHEPFNMVHARKYPGKCLTNFPYWYSYLSDENEAIAYRSISNSIEHKYNLFAQLKANESINELPRTLREYVQSYYFRARSFRLVIKDPIAFFSSEWLARRFDMDVIVMIRHPASISSSFQALQWKFDFSHLLNQPLLISKYLKNYEDEIYEYTLNQKSIIEQASLLWKLFYSAALTFKQEYKSWSFIRYEDFCTQPETSFRKIFLDYDLSISQRKFDDIMAHSKAYAASSIQWDSIKRDSAKNIQPWKARLTNQELSLIKETVYPISQFFYNEKDWE